MYASDIDSGQNAGGGTAPSQAPLAAPSLGTGSKRRSRIAAVSATLAVILIIVVFIAVTRPPTTTTTSPQIPAALSQKSNVLFGIPTASTLYNYYNSSSSSSYFVQYGPSFIQQFIQGSAVLSPNTTIPVPQQYSNTTSPLIVSFYVGAAPSYATAVSNYTSGIDTLMATFPGATETSASVGNMSTVFSYKAYGLNAYALLFVNNNHFVILNTFGTQNLNESYITSIAAHINSLISSASG